MGKKQKNEFVKQKLREQQKLRKQQLKEKRARLVVHNLPFTTTEENLKKHYEPFGEVDKVTLLKKPDGKLVGCGFVQFKLVQKAAKAKFHTNGKPFLGREIECEFALAKDKYVKVKKEVIKEETPIKVEIKEEPLDDYKTTVNTSIETINTSVETVDIKEEVEDEDAFAKVEKSEDEVEDDEPEEADEVNELSEEESGDEEEEADDKEEEQEMKSETYEKKPRVISNDVNEGKTVFVKNVPFLATNEDLKECMFQFGPLHYALICFDKITEHSKGTAFVKFKNIEDAEKCLEAGTELKLLGNILDCHKALSRNDVQMKNKDKSEQKQRDSRNLYLIKEGVILAGSKAAESVSATDMAKRLQLEQYKTQMLRNLNMFISNVRLIIHNVPDSWDDSKLRTLFLKHSNKNAVIKEARIMRDRRNVDSKGIGKSKEYGFVTFAKHEDALAALRSLNNNPNVFSLGKRPIVAFSIENRTVVKVREKRLHSSRLKNPKCNYYDPKMKSGKKDVKPFGAKRNIPVTSTKSAEEHGKFVGVTAMPGKNKMRSRYNLKTQAVLHHEHMKKQKKQKKFAKKTLEQKKKDFIRQPKQKINKNPKKRDDDNFSKLVNSYKKTILSAPASNRSKWYE